MTSGVTKSILVGEGVVKPAWIIANKHHIKLPPVHYRNAGRDPWKHKVTKLISCAYESLVRINLWPLSLRLSPPQQSTNRRYKNSGALAWKRHSYDERAVCRNVRKKQLKTKGSKKTIRPMWCLTIFVQVIEGKKVMCLTFIHATLMKKGLWQINEN
jgi:hypothetical protein